MKNPFRRRPVPTIREVFTEDHFRSLVSGGAVTLDFDTIRIQFVLRDIEFDRMAEIIDGYRIGGTYSWRLKKVPDDDSTRIQIVPAPKEKS